MGKPIKKTDLKTAWAKRILSHTKEARLAEYRKILVVTQDSESSKTYLTEWRSRLHGASTIVDVVKSVKAPMQIVQSLIARRKELEHRIARDKNLDSFAFDEVWVAFDKDSFPDFDSAVVTLRAMAPDGYYEAWTNECFELWYLLHYGAVDATCPLPRYEIFDKCSELFNTPDYESDKGKDGIHRSMAQKPIDEVRSAIKRATAIELAVKAAHGASAQPSALNPTTKLHHLISRFLEMTESVK